MVYLYFKLSLRNWVPLILPQLVWRRLRLCAAHNFQNLAQLDRLHSHHIDGQTKLHAHQFRIQQWPHRRNAEHYNPPHGHSAQAMDQQGHLGRKHQRSHGDHREKGHNGDRRQLPCEFLLIRNCNPFQMPANPLVQRNQLEVAIAIYENLIQGYRSKYKHIL